MTSPLPDWQPGDPIYSRPRSVNEGGHVRPMFQLIDETASLLMSTRGWCDACEVWSIRAQCWWCERDLSRDAVRGVVINLSSDASGTWTDPVATYA